MVLTQPALCSQRAAPLAPVAILQAAPSALHSVQSAFALLGNHGLEHTYNQNHPLHTINLVLDHLFA